MYLIIRHNGQETYYFGPFPTLERAKRYACTFPDETRYRVEPLIVPNCVQVKLNY